MRRAIRRLFFYPLLLAFVAAAVAWFVIVPSRPDRLARAVPAGARWIGVHRDLGGRWAGIAANPLVVEAAAACGVDSNEWAAALSSSASADWIGRLAGTEVVMAAFPVGPGRFAWGAASWIGGRSQRYRSWISAGRLPGCRHFTDHRGRPVWLVASPLLRRSGRHMAIAFEEGILLACVSDNPADILRMLDAYDGTAPREPEAERLLMEPGPDVILGDLGAGPGPDVLEVHLARFDAAGVEGTACLTGWEVPFPPMRRPDPASLGGLAALLGDHPAAVAVVPPAAAETAGAPLWQARWLSWMWGAARQSSGEPLVLALYGDPLGGRLRGLRIPGLTVSLPMRTPDVFSAAMDAVLDHINAERQWGLIRGPVPGASDLTMIEGTGPGPYAGLPANECATWTVAGGWLSVAASGDTLRALTVASAAGTPAGPAPWAVPSNLAGDAGWMRLDLPRTCETLQLSLSVYSLKRQIEDREGSMPLRARLAAVRDWLDVLGTLGIAEAGFDAAGDDLTIRFRAGR